MEIGGAPQLHHRLIVTPSRERNVSDIDKPLDQIADENYGDWNPKNKNKKPKGKADQSTMEDDFCEEEVQGVRPLGTRREGILKKAAGESHSGGPPHMS